MLWIEFRNLIAGQPSLLVQQPEKGVRSRSGIPATGGRSLAAERDVNQRKRKYERCRSRRYGS